jgi:hypothetical protein
MQAGWAIVCSIIVLAAYKFASPSHEQVVPPPSSTGGRLLRIPPVPARPESLSGMPAAASCRYVGTEGVYTHTVAYERDPVCPICSAGVPFTVQPTMTLREVGAGLCGYPQDSFLFSWFLGCVSLMVALPGLLPLLGKHLRTPALCTNEYFPREDCPGADVTAKPAAKAEL